MKPAPFEYLAPRRLDEALTALREHASDGKILAGGQSLMPLLNLRLVRPKMLIDLNAVSGLDDLDETAAGIAIGAMARQRTVERSRLVRERCPVLAEAIGQIGHVAIRHRGTVGGSLVHADPAAELPAVALALDAKFETAQAKRHRIVPAAEFYTDFLTTALGPDEILRRVVFPVLPPFAGYAVEEIARRHGDFAVAGAVAVADLDDGGKIAAARLALFGVAPVPVRARAAERSLRGAEPSDKAFREAAALVEEVLDPPTDVRATAAYRKHAAKILAARALKRAVARCRPRRSS